MSRFITPMTIALTLLALTCACQRGYHETADTDHVYFATSQKSFSSCKELASASSQAVPFTVASIAQSPQMVNGPFGKPLFSLPLWSTLDKDVPSALEFITHSLKLQVFKAHRSTRTFTLNAPPISNVFADLTYAPSALEKLWNENNTKRGTLAGLYIYREQSDRHLNPKAAAIIIQEDREKWTLIHEMIHHLFYIARRCQPDYLMSSALDDRIAKSQAQAKTLLERMSNNPSSQTADLYAQSLVQWSSSERQHLLRFAIEEIADEALMSELYTNGSFDHMLDMRLFGLNYMESAATSVTADLNRLESQMANATETMGGYFSEASRASLKGELESITRLKTEIAQVISDTQKRSFDILPDGKPGVTVSRTSLPLFSF